MLHCIYIYYTKTCARKKASMNYLEAKIVLLEGSPQIPFKLIAFEIVGMVAIAGILVRIFA